MHAQDRTFREIIGNSIQFIVPVFQRDYKWGQEQWQRLWDDINRVGSGKINAGHFLGSLVQIDTGRTTPALSSWLVIDGQQRLATLTLLAAALRDHINSIELEESESSLTVGVLDDHFLKNRHGKGDEGYKLILRRTDNATLHAIVDGNYSNAFDGSTSGQVADAYKFFRGQLSGCDPAALYNSIATLRIVEVTLDRDHDDPQFVFESLNDTGVDLSEGDKVRNYLLMSLEEQEQNYLYTEYWSKIEDNFRGEDGNLDDGLLNPFLQNYMVLKLKGLEQIRRNQIYDKFKESRNTIQGEGTLEQLLADMRRFAGYYATFEGRKAMPSRRLASAMGNLRHLGNTPAVLIMRLWDCYDHLHTLTEGNFIRALGLIESYLLRHTICGHQIRSFRRIFAEMTLDIDEETPAESLCRTLAKPRGSYDFWTFQSDNAFSKAIQTTNLARFQICKYILERLENFENKEPTETKCLQIEHIMPQNPENWKKTLGENWRQIHEEWLHRLGNLTLTGHNPEMSDLCFEHKKTIKGGYNDATVRITKFVREQPVWTSEQMKTRGRSWRIGRCGFGRFPKKVSRKPTGA